MVKIECPHCARKFNPPESADTDKFDGEVKCPKCKTLLSVKLVKGKIQKCKTVKKLEPVTEIQKIEFVPAKKTERQEGNKRKD